MQDHTVVVVVVCVFRVFIVVVVRSCLSDIDRLTNPPTNRPTASIFDRAVCVSILAVCPACGAAVKEHVLPKALVLMVSSVLQEAGLESLTLLFKQMILSGVVPFDVLLSDLDDKADSTVMQAVSNVAKCVGVIAAATTEENRKVLVASLLRTLEGKDGPKTAYSLMVSGDLGRLVDYATMDNVADRFEKVYMQSFSSDVEHIKQAASYALGRSAFGSQSSLLPAITGALESGDEKTQYLLLSALREFIRCLKKSDSDTSTESVSMILPHLVAFCSSTDEGTRSLVAECLGSLTCAQADTVLTKMRELLSEHSSITAEAGIVADDDTASSKNVLVCWTVATSVKHAVASKASQTALAAAMPDFLKLLEVTEVSVKNAALLMVYSAVHHMPQLVASFMKDLIFPSLYEVSGLKLTRIVDLGPFKHNVDDALPLRKSAMSIFATSLEKLPGSLDLASFMPVLAKALGDLEDVQLQAFQIVVTMSQRFPAYLVAAVDDFAPSFEAMFTDKIIKRKTNNKTGTELERAREWIKSGLRALLAMNKLDGVSRYVSVLIVVSVLVVFGSAEPLRGRKMSIRRPCSTEPLLTHFLVRFPLVRCTHMTKQQPPFLDIGGKSQDQSNRTANVGCRGGRALKKRAYSCRSVGAWANVLLPNTLKSND